MQWQQSHFNTSDAMSARSRHISFCLCRWHCITSSFKWHIFASSASTLHFSSITAILHLVTLLQHNKLLISTNQIALSSLFHMYASQIKSMAEAQFCNPTLQTLGSTWIPFQILVCQNVYPGSRRAKFDLN